MKIFISQDVQGSWQPVTIIGISMNEFLLCFLYLGVVLGNKCAGHHNLKTVKIREILLNKIYGEFFFAHKSF